MLAGTSSVKLNRLGLGAQVWVGGEEEEEAVEVEVEAG